MDTKETPVNIIDHIYLPNSVRDCQNYNGNNDWLLFEISKSGFSNNTFLIYVTTDTYNTIYMKPYEPYMNKEFEDLFDFGFGCNNYDANKIISINDKDYYKKFKKYLKLN